MCSCIVRFRIDTLELGKRPEKKECDRVIALVKDQELQIYCATNLESHQREGHLECGFLLLPLRSLVLEQYFQTVWETCEHFRFRQNLNWEGVHLLFMVPKQGNCTSYQNVQLSSTTSGSDLLFEIVKSRKAWHFCNYRLSIEVFGIGEGPAMGALVIWDHWGQQAKGGQKSFKAPIVEPSLV